MKGFLVFDYENQYPQALKELAQWVAEDKIKSRETIVKGGLRQAERALRDLYSGINTGKDCIHVSLKLQCLTEIR